MSNTTNPSPPDSGFATVYSTTEIADAVTIQALLKGSGIEAEVRDYHAGLTAFGMPTVVAPINVIVAAPDGPEASQIIQKAKKPGSSRTASNRRMWLLAAVLVGGPIILLLLVELLGLL